MCFTTLGGRLTSAAELGVLSPLSFSRAPQWNPGAPHPALLTHKEKDLQIQA